MASIPIPTAQANVDLRACIREATRNGMRLLIVGCPPGTFPYWLGQHRSVLLWPASEAKQSDDRRIVPPEIGVILITKLLSHALERNVRHQARQRHIACPSETFSPGAINRLLEGVIVDERKTADDEGEREMPKHTGPTHVVEPPPVAMDDATAQLVEQINDAIASLQLVREQVIENGRKLAGLSEQLDALAMLRKVLK